MNWITVSESTLSIIFAAFAIAVSAWFASRIRNQILEKRLAQSLSPNGIGMEFNSLTKTAKFTLQVHNYADAAIRVRSIVLIADKFHIELRRSTKHFLNQTPLTNEIVALNFSRKIFAKGFLEEDGNPHAMLLPPKTMGVWEVDPQTIGSREWKIAKVYLAFEYTTLFGNVALVRIEPNNQTLTSIRESFEPLSRALHSGNFEEMNSLFKLPHTTP